MARDISLTFEDGSSHIYNGVPDEATPDDVMSRASKDFSGRAISHIARGPEIGSGPLVTPASQAMAVSPALRRLESTGQQMFGDVPQKSAVVAPAVEQPKPETITGKIKNFVSQKMEPVLEFAGGMVPFSNAPGQVRDLQAQRRSDIDLVNKNRGVMDGEKLTELDYSPEVAASAKAIRDRASSAPPSMTETKGNPIRMAQEYSAGDYLNNPVSVALPVISDALSKSGDAVRSKFAQGGLGIAQNVADLADKFGLVDPFLPGKIAEAAAKEKKSYNDVQLGMNEEGKLLREGVAQSATTLPASLITMAARGNPLTAAATMIPFGAQVYGPEYSDNRAAGKGIAESMGRATLATANEVGTEILGNIISGKMLPGLGHGATWKEAAAFAAKSQGIDMVGELLSTRFDRDIANVLGDRLTTDAEYNKSLIDTIKQTIIQTIVGGGAMTGVSKGMASIDRMDPNAAIGKELGAMVRDTTLPGASTGDLERSILAGRAAGIDTGASAAVPPIQPPSARSDRSPPAPGAPMAPISAQVSQPLAQEAPDEAVANPPPGSERMPGGMPMAALQQGGMPTSAMPVADGIDAGVWAERGEAADDRSYDLGLAKGERQKAKRAVTSPEEDASLSSSAAQWGVDPADAIAEARKIKLNYPAKAGWAQPVALRVAEKGSTLNDRIEFAKIPYTFQNPPGMNRAPRDNSAWEGEIAKRMTAEMVQLTERAKSDPVARTIIDHMTWYREMSRRLRQEFGGFGDVFADLLGATSPNTPVRTNWNFSVDILRRFVRGEFDSQLAALEQHLAAGGSSEEFKKAGELITQITGKKYGMNSDKAMKALLGMWRSVKAGDAPKARNFALNLIGQSDKATIDVWAARMLHRLAGYPRIPPKAESAVGGNHLADPSQVGGQFGFGQAVFEKVAAALRAQGIDVTAPDLQAVAWFMEKEIWTKNGWTRGLGSEGSFENEADKMPVDRYQVGATVAQYEHEPTNPEMRQASNDFTRSLEQDPDVIAYRSIPTVGMYAGSGERSLDTEVVASAGWNPSRLIADVVSAAKAADQYDAFVSRVLGPNEPSANWRPGIELYFKTERDAAFAESVIDQITKSGIDGFTLIKDPRAARGMTGEDAGGYIGLRLQYVPEIFMRWADESVPAQKTELDILRSGDQNAITGLMHSKQALMDDAIRRISAVTDIAHVAIAHYDTLVIGKENYDDYTGESSTIDRSSRAAGGITGQSAAEVLQAAAIRLGIESKGRNGEGTVSGRSTGLPLQEVNQGGAPLRSLSVRGKSYDLDAENFGFPADPKPLENDHPLLRPTMSESGQSIYAPDHIRGNTELGPGMTTSALHVAIVNSHFDGKEPPKGRKPKLILMAGGGGAGKGHVKSLLEGDGLIPHGAIDLDPDEIKTKMIPEFGQLAALGDSRGAATTHEESSILAKAVFSRAMKGGYDIVFDRTMAEFEKGMKLMQDAVSAGYEVEMHAVMTDARMAAVQAMGRAQHTFRYVPSSAFLKAHKGIAAYLDRYMESGLISSAVVWDNRGTTIPIAELSASEYNILDGEAYRDMVDSGADINVEATTLGGIYGNAREESDTSRRAWGETEATMDGSTSRIGALEGRDSREQGRAGGERSRTESQQGTGLPVGDLQQGGQTDTPEFKKWFGDWDHPKAFSSKFPADKTPPSMAMDWDANKPLVLFHATNADFDIFETGRESITSTTFGPVETRRHAIFTTPDVKFAESYLKKGVGQNVMPVYMDIKSPMDLRNNGAWDYVDELVANGFENHRWPNRSDTEMWEMFDDETGEAFVAAAKKAGYDGAIMHEVNDDDKMVEVYVAFDPTQIKSATGNNGQFDGSNPDIRFQAGGQFVYSAVPITDATTDLGKATSPKMDERAMDKRGLQPLEGRQPETISNAIADLISAGGISPSWAKSVTFYGLKPIGLGYANYNPVDRSVGVQWTTLDEAGRGGEQAKRYVRGWVAHELHHAVDNYRTSGDTMYYISMESPRMEMAFDGQKWVGSGDLMTEAISLWESTSNGEMKGFLDYPMVSATTQAKNGDEKNAGAFAKVEMFAQMGAMYSTNPDLMRQEAPRWFEFFEEWSHARGADGSVDRSRVTLRNIFQKSVPDSGRARNERRSGLEAGSLAAGGAGTDLGPGRSGMGANGPGPRDDGVRAPLQAASQKAQPGQEALKRLWGYQPAARAEQPSNNHLPTHVNYSTFDDAKGLHTIFSTMSRDFEKQIQQQRRGTIAIEQSYREARALISDEAGLSQAQIDKMLGRKAGTAAGAAEILARMALLESATSEVDRLSREISQKGALQISEKEALEFAAALDRAAMAHATFLGARAEIGRAMNAIKNFKGMPYDEGTVQNVLRTFSGKEGLAKVAQAITDGLGSAGDAGAAGAGSHGRGGAGRAAAIGRLATAASKPTILDAAIEAWKAGLLSAPPTHLANVLGNAVFTLMRVPTASIAGIVGALSMQHDRARMGEVLSMMVGLLHGGAGGLRAAWNTLKDEDATIGPTPTEERQHAISGATFGAPGKLGTMIDYLGKGVRTPFRALSSADSFFKVINMYMTLYSEATRAALMEGGRYWHSGFTHRVAELINEGAHQMLDPGHAMGPYPISDKGRAIGDRAIQDGLKYTFQEKLGKIGQWIESGRHAVPALHFVIPFVRTPTNIFRVTLEHTPFAPLSRQYREEIKAGGARMNNAISQVIMGSALGAAAYFATAAGLMTGGGDPEKEARKRRRELNIPDYGIKINGKWYEMRRLEPLGTLLGAAADVAEVSKYMTKEENEHAAMAISLAFSNAVLNKTYMRGLNDLLNVLTDPERYGASWEQSMAGTAVPSGVAFMAQEQDPWVRDAKVRGDMPAMEKFMQTIANGVKARLPKTDLNPEFNRQSLPIAIDSWGQPRKQDEKLFTGAPIKAMTESQDPVRQEAFKVRAKGGDVGEKVRGVKVNSSQYETMSREGGQLAHDVMAGIVQSPAYAGLPDAQKIEVFHKVLSKARQFGRDIITPDLIDKIIEKRMKKGGFDEHD